MGFTSKKVIGVCLAIVLMTSLALPARANTPSSSPQQSDSAGAALREGRRLLKRGQADKALIQLRNSLNLYTAAKNNSGMAAAHNELGDLYMRQGQYEVALDHYQKALDGFLVSDRKEAVNAAAVSAVAPVAAPVAAIADDKYNANLMLAKIGDVNFRLGKTAESRAAYGRMVVKKPEGAASKVGRRFGGLSAIAGGISTGRVSVSAPTSAATTLLEAKKELDEYRNSIVYSSYELGMGRLGYADNDLE
jgi:tetratricopeptide (TPR) repeat protein